MRITDIEVTPVAVPTEAEIKGSSYQKEYRGPLVGRVETDSDVVGEVYRESRQSVSGLDPEVLHSGDILDTEIGKATDQPSARLDPERAGR